MTTFWKSNPKHWCKRCKVFIDAKPRSIKKHETGDKHKENVQRHLRGLAHKRRDEERKAANAAKAMESINDAAMLAYQKDINGGRSLDTAMAVKNFNTFLNGGGPSGRAGAGGINPLTIGGYSRADAIREENSQVGFQQQEDGTLVAPAPGIDPLDPLAVAKRGQALGIAQRAAEAMLEVQSEEKERLEELQAQKDEEEKAKNAKPKASNVNSFNNDGSFMATFVRLAAEKQAREKAEKERKEKEEEEKKFREKLAKERLERARKMKEIVKSTGLGMWVTCEATTTTADPTVEETKAKKKKKKKRLEENEVVREAMDWGYGISILARKPKKEESDDEEREGGAPADADVEIVEAPALVALRKQLAASRPKVKFRKRKRKRKQES